MKRLRDILHARLRIGAFLLLGLPLGGCGWLGENAAMPAAVARTPAKTEMEKPSDSATPKSAAWASVSP